MTEHLDDTQLRGFVAGTLAPEDLLDIDDHLGRCVACRERATMLAGPAELADLAAAVEGISTHLSDDELQQFVEGTLPPDREPAVHRHLAECEVCGAQADDLSRWAATPPVRRVPLWLAAAAVLVLALLVPTAFRLLRQPAPAPESGSLAGLESLPPGVQGRMRAALSAGVATLPPFASELAGTREVLMGAPAGTDAFAVTRPVATGVGTAQPTFEWERLDGAASYVVSVFDEQAHVIARSGALAGTTWTPDAPLPAGRTLVWQVTADRDGHPVTAPVAPAPPARFRIVDAATAATVDEVEAAHPDAHVLVGVLCAEAGLLDRARMHLEQVPASDSNAELARRTLGLLGVPQTR